MTRHPNALEFELPDGKIQVVTSGDTLFHPDGKEIVTDWLPSDTAADVEYRGETIQAYALFPLTGPRFLRVVNASGWLEYGALPLFYSNELSDLANLATLQRLVAPQAVTGFADGDWVRYPGAYGTGVDLELCATPQGVQKWLNIASVTSLPRPNTLIRAAGGQALEVPMSLNLSSGIRARIRSGELSLDLSAAGENAVALVDVDGNEVLALRRPFAVDANGEMVAGQLKFRRSLSGLQVSSSYPLDWLRSAAFPVRLDPTVTQSISTGANDYHANAEGNFDPDFVLAITNTASSSSTDIQTGFRFVIPSIPRYSVIDSATFAATANEAPANPVTMDVHLEAGINPAAATTAADHRSRALTTAKVSWPFTTSMNVGRYTAPDIKALVQEQIDKGNMTALIVRLRDSDRANTTVNRRIRWRAIENTEFPNQQATLTIVYGPPPAVTGAATFEMPAPTFSASADVSQTTSGSAVFSMPAPTLEAEATVGTPPARSAGASFEMPAPSFFGYGGEADPKEHTLFRVEPLVTDTHHFVTEAGELLGFATSFDDTLGTPRTGVLGLGDDAWFSASNLRTREPGPLAFNAHLVDHDRAKLARDRLARALPDVRTLVLPDGRIFGIDRADYGSKPSDATLTIEAVTTGAYPRHPLLSGIVSAAFPTVESTDELPIYAVDTAGGIVAPLAQKTAPTGALYFALKANERGILSLGSVGTPVAADGTSLQGSVTASYQDKSLVISLWGVETRIRETELATFGAVLVCYLVWTRHSAWLVVVSARGSRTYNLRTGKPTALSEPILTAGVRADGVGSGAFMALGSHSLGVAYFSPRVPSRLAAVESAQALYDSVTGPDMTWEVPVPDASLELIRADAKPLELAPGETITTDFAVVRTNYAGPLEFSTSSSQGLTVSYAALASPPDTYRVTITAPAATPEGSQTFRATVKAQGADNEGSFLVDVRDDFNAIVEVAASPAIMPNATSVRLMHDPINQRATEILRDSSANANTFFWAGYARPDRRYMGILATGKHGAAVFSDGLANAAQAQRMGAEQTFCMVWGEVAKTPVGGVMYQVAAVGSENGVHVLREQGGFKLRTVNGAATVTSPDTLAYNGGNARHILLIGTTEIFLIDRDTGRSIRLARPAWADAAVRTTVGALRSAAGALTSVTRAHLLADIVHPYALSPIQQRRNIDALTPYVPTGDVAEWPDTALGLFFWDDGAQKYLNHAAPALGITAVPIGTVDAIPGGVYPRGGGAHVYIETGIPASSAVTAITAIQDFKGSHTVEYEAQLAFAMTTGSSASAMLARHANGQPFAMIRNTDFTHKYGIASWTPVSGDNLFKVRFNPPGKELTVTALANGASETVKSSNSYSGSIVVSLGAVRRADGNNDRRTPTKNRALIICRGDMSADEVSVTRQLLTA